MADYNVIFARSARKEMERLDAVTAMRVFQKLELLAQVPRPHGCQKLQGEKNLWRIRVGDYRVVYSVDDPEEPWMSPGFAIVGRFIGIFERDKTTPA